jgi:DNA-binding LytR/AlgR family response regulator
MKVLIIEDEYSSSELIKEELNRLKVQVEVVDVLQTVEEAIQFLKRPQNIDLIFMDIKLSDGQSFDIFDKVQLNTPVIFITAYSEFLIKAFTNNGIDYLLKPIDSAKLYQSITKFKQLENHFANSNFKKIAEYLQPQKNKKILIKRGNEYQTLLLSDAVYFFVENKIVFCVDKNNKKYITEWANLIDAYEEINNAVFFKANRKYIISHHYIKSFKSAEFGKVIVELIINPNEEIIISQDNAHLFKKWLKSEEPLS